MTRLDGKVAIITGGAHGQGRATARVFIDAGATVWITDVDDVAVKRVADELGCPFFHHDVTGASQWAELVELVVGRDEQIDVLVNNAAIIEWKTMTETTPDVWARVVAVNQTGPLLGMQAVAPVMKRQRGGSIINISSIGGLGGSSPCFAYGATKWALRGMTRGAAQELGPFGVRVNAVLPGIIESRMIEGQDTGAMAAAVPLGRIARPEEVAALSLWLASDDSSYVSGADYLVDGGLTA